jgi:hypothetical protein
MEVGFSHETRCEALLEVAQTSKTGSVASQRVGKYTKTCTLYNKWRSKSDRKAKGQLTELPF